MRFSVIVPLYNKAAYVEKSLRSVLAQTFMDYELIVVNDGSTDSSLSVAENVLNGTPATIVSQKNAGVSAARNIGVSISHGEYICFLDADDWWDDCFLAEMDMLIQAYPDAGIYGTNYYYVKNGKYQQRIHIPTGYFNYFKEYADYMQMPLTSISVALPRCIFNEVNGFKLQLKLGEDFDLWVRIALEYKTVFLNKPLAYYNQDVDVSNRGIGHLQNPDNHMLWNLDYLNSEENTNHELKQLLDNLRVYSLMPYYLSKQFHDKAKKELNKVNWDNQPKRIVKKYNKPIWFLRSEGIVMKIGSEIKQWIIRQRYDS